LVPRPAGWQTGSIGSPAPLRRRNRGSQPEVGGSYLGIVQHMLGHSDPNTTEWYYGHYDLTDLEQAMDQFAKTPR